MEALLSQKKSKSRKINRKKSATARNRKTPRTIALAIPEPKLRGQPSGNGADAREDKPLRALEPLRAVVEVARTETKPSSSLPLSETTMLCWSPWNVMLRQQAFVVYALSNVMRAQQQFARMLSS
jgi:hypothetical protein